mgnify:CR=1 FL=1
MQLNNLVERLRRFDAYPKTLEDFRVKTFGGATGKWLINKVVHFRTEIISDNLQCFVKFIM